MKILYRYFFTLFLKQIFLIQSVILILYTFFSLIGSIDMLGKYKASIWHVLYYELIKLPQAVYDTLPITVVASTLLVMITLIKQNELIAFVSVGGKIRNLAIPFLLVGAVLSVAMFLLSEHVNPKIEYAREKYKKEEIKKQKFISRNKLFDLWIRDVDKIFVNVDFIDPIGKQIRGLTEYYLDDDYKVNRLKNVESGVFKDGKWEFTNEKTYELQPVPKLVLHNPVSSQQHDTLTDLINLPGDNHKYLNASDFGRIISVYEEKGLNVDRYELFFYKTFAHPLSVMVLILVVLPMSITLSRHHSYVMIASRALTAGFTYWILNAALFSLSKTGVISPFFANFLPHILLSIFAAFYISKREKGQ